MSSGCNRDASNERTILPERRTIDLADRQRPAHRLADLQTIDPALVAPEQPYPMGFYGEELAPAHHYRALVYLESSAATDFYQP